MTEKIIIAGAGGQGIMLAGKVLAVAAMRQAREVSWLPAYGAEVRGGAAHCSVIISEEEIGSPWIERADTLIVMNELSLRRFQERIKNKGLVIINSSLATSDFKNDSVAISRYPFTEIAVQLGNIRIANVVALGCYLAKKKIISIDSVIKAMEEIAPRGRSDLIEINRKALFSGKELVND